MPHVNQINFGPGALESLTLSTWVARRNGPTSKLKGKLEGTYTVYCGYGWEHTVEISEEVSGWNTEDHEEARLLTEVHNASNTDKGHTLADLLLDFALEDFEDPCADEESEEF